jgi:hypothetical protein
MTLEITSMVKKVRCWIDELFSSYDLNDVFIMIVSHSCEKKHSYINNITYLSFSIMSMSWNWEKQFVGCNSVKEIFPHWLSMGTFFFPMSFYLLTTSYFPVRTEGYIYAWRGRCHVGAYGIIEKGTGKKMHFKSAFCMTC